MHIAASVGYFIEYIMMHGTININIKYMNYIFCIVRNVCQIDTHTMNIKDMGLLDEIKDLNTSMSTAIINPQKHNNKSTTVFMHF